MPYVDKTVFILRRGPGFNVLTLSGETAIGKKIPIHNYANLLSWNFLYLMMKDLITLVTDNFEIKNEEIKNKMQSYLYLFQNSLCQVNYFNSDR